jgi:biotin carboxyl carrier protein
MKLEIQLTGAGGKTKRVVEFERDGRGYRVVVDGKHVDADVVQVTPNTISVLLNGQSFEVHVSPEIDGRLKLQTGPHEFIADLDDPRAWRGRKHGTLEAEGRQPIVAPMPGKVIRILMKAGDTVAAKQGIAVIEAMKMQNEIRSPKSGKIERVLVKEGQNVSAGEILAWVE